MNRMKSFIRDFIRDEEGLTVLEYIIGAALLVVGLTLVFTNYGSILQSKLISILGKVT